MKRSFWLVAVVVLVAVLALAGVAAAANGGSVTPRNDKASSDKIEIQLTGLPAPAAGTVYVGWLVSSDGAKTVNTGVLTLGADGAVNATFTSPSGENLVGLYAKFVVTAEKDADKAGAAPKGTAVLEAPNAPPWL